MTEAVLIAQPRSINLGISVNPVTLTLSDGSTLTISDNVPLTAASRRTSVLGGLIYFFGGRIDKNDGPLGGYLGESSVLGGPRAATSLTKWIISQRRILPAGMALLRRDEPYEDDFRLFIEAKAIMNVSAAGLWLLNTHTSAGLASSRLTRTQVRDGQILAHEIADAILLHLFAGNVNKHPSPAANTRESAVRTVMHSPRGMDVFDVMRGLHAAGVTTKGRTWDFSLRRDLRVRELETRGTPRVVSTWHRNRRVFWNPLTLSKTHALDGYDRAHPVPR